MVGYRGSLIAAMAVFLVVDGAAIAARLYVRTRMISRGLGLDDLVLGITYIAYVIRCGLASAAMGYGYAAEEQRPSYDPAKAKQFYYANQLTLYIASGLVKLAVALVLCRLASTRRMRWLLYGSMVVVGVWTVVMTLYASWLCASGGSSNYAGSETCAFVGYFRTATNIVIDYFYALLPIYMIWRVQMSTKLRLTVVLLLGLGFFASSATIVKLVVIIRLTHATAAEATGYHYELLLWADIELGMAIFAASAAAFKPLLKLFPALWGERTPRSSGSDRSDGPFHPAAGGEKDRHHRLAGGGAASPSPGGAFKPAPRAGVDSVISTGTVDEAMGFGRDHDDGDGEGDAENNIAAVQARHEPHVGRDSIV